MTKLWGGRFTKATDKLVEEYTASITFEKNLVYEEVLLMLQLQECNRYSGLFSNKRPSFS